ncbi:MAG TPA: hypothetical protein PLY94_07055, partial [Gemmatimonadaceae bacterium]|nr:hypothetical protein [Gemmatimonadaceae bacterium]
GRHTLFILGVAVASYGDAALEQHGALETARAVHDSLAAVAGSFYACRSRLLLGAEATQPALRDALDRIAAEIQPGDVFAFYYRGLAAPRFLVLSDSLPLPPPPTSPTATPPPEFERRLQRSEQFAAWLAALPTRAQLLVFDAPGGASYFESLRVELAPPMGARVATRDLTAFATPGLPVMVAGATHPATALGLALLQSLGEEGRDAPIRLASALANRVLERLDYPVMVHQAGADLVLGTSASSLAIANAAALADTLPWTSSCGERCPQVQPVGVQQSITLYGSSAGLPAGARLWVNGRRARLAGDDFEVELPPAALRESLRIRALLPDGTRFETTGRLP